MGLQHTNGMLKETNNNDYSIKNEELVERIEVENTPFTVAGVKQGWFVLIGNTRLTDGLESKEEALEDAKRVDWERMMQVMSVMIEQYAKLTIEVKDEEILTTKK